MKSNDIVFQVSEETAEVMEEISEQLFDESAARFDEIADDIAAFKREVCEQNAQATEKADRLLASMADVSEHIRVISANVSESAEAGKESEAAILQAVNAVSVGLAELHRIQVSVMDKLNSDDSQKKLTCTLSKLAEMENEILQTKEAVDNTADKLIHCNELTNNIVSSVNDLQANDERLLDKGAENTGLILKKMDSILSCLDTLSVSIQTVAEKQTELEKDVKFLKLSFFKRLLVKIKSFFTKGRE